MPPSIPATLLAALAQGAAPVEPRLGAAPVVAALVLAVVHVVTPGLRWLDGTPRSVWLSIAGGVSVAYVFVHLLPELAEGQAHVSRALGVDGATTRAGAPVRVAERHVYLVALAGLAAFYGLDKLAHRSRGQRAEEARGDAEGSDAEGGDAGPGAATADAAMTSAGVFWVHMASFALYNGLIGYLLVQGERATAATLAFFTVAMALHFVVTDYGLLEHHKAPYRRVGRWVLVAALAVGVAVGYATALPAATVAVLVAFLAGGVILNVLKEEVPSERRSRFWAFGAGMAAYAALLLLV